MDIALWSRWSRRLATVSLVVAAGVLTGCASTGEPGMFRSAGDKQDPIESVNRVTYKFNDTLDKALMLNFVEMNLPKATVSITARGLAALKATQHLRRAERLPIGSSKSLSLSP